MRRGVPDSYPNTCGHGDSTTQACRLCIEIDIDSLEQEYQADEKINWWEQNPLIYSGKSDENSENR
jgi:hypothetical protein